MQLSYNFSHRSVNAETSKAGYSVSCKAFSVFRSDRLDALMKELGLSQSELARRVGVSQSTIWKLLNGDSGQQGTKFVHKIAHEVSTTSAFLMDETDDRFSEQPGETYSSDEREWVQLLRSLAPKDRAAALQLVRTIATSAQTSTLNQDAMEFRR